MALWSYTMIVTFVVDMAIIAPALIIAGYMLLNAPHSVTY